MARRQPRPAEREQRTRTPSSDVTRSLLAAAAELLGAHGPDALTVRTVAEHAGVAPMGVYSRFDGKAGLVEALFVQGFERLHETVRSASGPDARTRLVAACHAYRTFAIANPHHYALMFQTSSEVEVGEAASLVAREAFGELESRAQDAMDAGVLRRADRTETAQQIWSALHGAVALEIAGIGFTADHATTYGLLVGAVLDGLARPPARSR